MFSNKIDAKRSNAQKYKGSYFCRNTVSSFTGLVPVHCHTYPVEYPFQSIFKSIPRMAQNFTEEHGFSLGELKLRKSGKCLREHLKKLLRERDGTSCFFWGGGGGNDGKNSISSSPYLQGCHYSKKKNHFQNQKKYQALKKRKPTPIFQDWKGCSRTSWRQAGNLIPLDVAAIQFLINSASIISFTCFFIFYFD